MANYSHAVTYLLPIAETKAMFGDAVFAAVPSGPERNDLVLLYATSRHSYQEYILRQLIVRFSCKGLSYLRSWDDIVDSEPWMTALYAPELTQAIAGLHQLLAGLQQAVANGTDVLEEPSEVFNVDMAAAFAAPHAPSFTAAREAYDAHVAGGDGHDGRGLVLWLIAHTRLLQQALDDQVAVVHGLYL